MIHKYCFEMLDRMIRDCLSFVNPCSAERTFDIVLLGGDYRQILSVVPKSTRRDIVESSINSTYLWNSCKVEVDQKICLNRLALGVDVKS